MHAWQIEVEKGALANRRRVETKVAAGDGEVLAAVDRVAVTANNVTYAVHGAEPLHYWRFFPASDDRFCVVPLWGFATIVESRHPDVAVGTRFYGYWPSASHVRLVPGAVKDGGFSDTAPHRAGLAPIYNLYVPAARIAADAEQEALAALFRPLFGTAFVLDDFLGREPAATTLILTSASSKTALGTAFGLSRRSGLEVIGLTSTGNKEFVEKTGYYSAILTYDEIIRLDSSKPCILVDFAGNGNLLARLHGLLGGLVASHIVGDTHWSTGPAHDLPGPKPALFFAPAVWAARAQAIGTAAFEAELARASTAFHASARTWLHIVERSGADGFDTAFGALVEGSADPAEGQVVRFTAG